MTEQIKIITVAISMALGVLMVISQLLDIKAKLANEKAMLQNLRASFLVRNWPMLLVLVLGATGMLSIALGPVSQLSVLFCVLGGVLAAAGMAAIFVLEIARLQSQKMLEVLTPLAEAQRDTLRRMVSVQETGLLPDQRTADKPQ